MLSDLKLVSKVKKLPYLLHIQYTITATHLYIAKFLTTFSNKPLFVLEFLNCPVVYALLLCIYWLIAQLSKAILNLNCNSQLITAYLMKHSA